MRVCYSNLVDMFDVCLMFIVIYYDLFCCEVLLVFCLGIMFIFFCFGGIFEVNYVYLVMYYV